MNSEGLGPSKKMSEDRSVLRWGGIAGLLSAGVTVISLLTIIAFSQPLFVSVQPEDICGPSCYVGASLPDFPASRTALMIHHAFYVLTIMLIAILVVSLYRVLSRESSNNNGSIAPGTDNRPATTVPVRPLGRCSGWSGRRCRGRTPS